MGKLLKKYETMSLPAKASLWFVFCGILQKGITFLTTPIFSRLLTTAEFGVVSVFSTWNGIIIIIATLNLSAGVYLRGLVKYSEDRKVFTSSIQWLFISSVGITFLLYLCFFNKINNLIQLSPNYIIAIFIDILVCSAFQFWSSRQRVDYLYRNLVIVTLFNSILKPILGIIAILLFEDNISARIYSMVLADSIAFGPFLIDVVNFRKNKISTKYWKYALNYNIPLVPHYLSGIVLNQADRVMIKSMVGASEAGIYSLAYNLAAIMTIVNQSITNSFNPWLYKEMKNENYSSISEVANTLLLLVAGANLILIIMAPEVIYILAPKSYYEAIWAIPPVAMSVYFNFVYNLFSNIEFYYEKTKFMMVASIVVAILNIVLNWIFIPIYGYLAAGYTTLACFLCFSIAHYIVMKRIMDQNIKGIKIYDIKNIVLISLLFTLVGTIFMSLYNYFIIRVVIILFILGICYMKKDLIFNILTKLKK